MNGPETSSSDSENDLFAILMAVGAMFLLVATIVMLVRSQQLFGSWLPFGGA